MALKFEPVENPPEAPKPKRTMASTLFKFEPVEPGSLPPLSDAEKGPSGEPGTLERMAEGVDPATVTGGALIGAQRGSQVPGGPLAKIAGTIAGGAMGAAAGSGVFDNVRNALISTGIIKGETHSAGEVTEKMGKEAMWDAAFGMGMPAAGKAYNFAKAKGLGITEEASRLGESAKDYGINLGISDVSEGMLPRGYEKVAGVFPIVGSPIRKAAERKVGEVAAAQDRLISGIGDIKGVTDVGEELTGAAKKRFDVFKTSADKKYEAWREFAESTGADMPTLGIRSAAFRFVDDFDKARSAYYQMGTANELPPIKEPVFIEQARRMVNLQPNISVTQYEGLMRDFDAALRQSQKDGFNFKNVDLIRRAAKHDFDKISHTDVRNIKKNLDSWFGDNVKTFQTPTAKKFGLVDKHAFGVGFEEAGTRNADEILPIAFNTKSPKAMSDLRQLVGEGPMRNAVASHLENAYDKSLVTEIVRGQEVKVIDPAKFRAAVGLDRPGSAQWKTLDAALKESGSSVTASGLDKFMKAVEAAVGRGSPEPSSFLARRAVLGGAGAVETALPLGALYATGNPSVLMGFYLGHLGSKKLTDPKHLQAITDIINPRSPEVLRDAAISRVMKGLAAEGLLDAMKQ